MELWLAIGSVAGTTPPVPVEVAVQVSGGTLIADLVESLCRRLDVACPPRPGLLVDRTRAVLDAASTIASVDLRFGDRVSVVSMDSPRTGSLAGRHAIARMSVLGGPASGQTFDLGAGDHVVGRAAHCEIPLDDPAMSRTHVRISISGTGVVVEDAGSSNGTFLEGVPIVGATHVSKDDIIEAGHSLLRFEPLQAAQPDGSTAINGKVLFNRPPRRRSAPRAQVFHPPAVPSAPERRRLPKTAALGPLMMGLPLVVISAVQGNTTLMIMGLVTVLCTPLIAVLSNVEDRRSGGRSHVQRVNSFERSSDELIAELRQALAAEVAERRGRAPTAVDLIQRVEMIRADLWERRPDDDDFLSLAVGRADQPRHIEVDDPAGGDETLRRSLQARIDELQIVRNVPVVVDMVDARVVGLCGDHQAVHGSARWLVCQLAVLHSPRDVDLVFALASVDEAQWGWVTWLPHTRSHSSPLAGPKVVVGEVEAASLFESLASVVRARLAEKGQRLGGRQQPTPAIVVVLSEALDIPRSSVTTLLESGPDVGIHVIWLGSERRHLPGECGVVVAVAAVPPSAVVTVPSSDSSIRGVVLDEISVELASSLARRLACVEDVTAGGVRGQIPAAVSLLDLLALPEPDAAQIAAIWARSSPGVDAPVGVSAGGPFVLDMRSDGPHALVGGTTGAGKSELLQTVVAALAVRHPPHHVTFLLVDYKGGAAFKDCVALPHTVGMVTDLDGHLVNRALVSLNAELRRREHLLRDHGAKDLLEMERRFPDAAPPALLLIVDEFASLAKELPEFVDGVVNVAQRGRSLGIHLVLATQRPAGAINDNVRANTNLRIALRMNDQADSQDVINAKDAALLPRSLPGRAFVRTGQSELSEVQIAYVGGQSVAGASNAVLDAKLLVRGRTSSDDVSSSAPSDAPTDLQLVVSCIVRSFVDSGMDKPRAPWVPPLPAVVSLASVPEPPSTGTAVLGLADLPDRQEQRFVRWDPENDGNLLVFGSGGSGKTSLLRSIVMSFARSHAVSELQMYVLDFATQELSNLDRLPHVGAVLTGEEIERTQRLIVTLEQLVQRRKDQFAVAGVGRLSEYRTSVSEGGAEVPRVIVALDGYAGFTTAFEKIDFGEWIDRFHRLMADGRSLGLSFAVTVARATGISQSVATTAGLRVVLKMTDPDDYGALGLDGRNARKVVLPPGRGFVGSTVETQFCLVGDDPAGSAQQAWVARDAARLSTAYDGSKAPGIGTLPASVDRNALPVAERLQAAFGIGQRDLVPVRFDLALGGVLIAGPNRSGKSTALLTVALALAASTPDALLFCLTPRRSALSDAGVWTRSASGVGACEELIAELSETIAARSSTTPVIVFIDDATELDDSSAASVLEHLARRGRDLGVSMVVAAESSLARRSYSGPVPEIRRDRQGVLLMPDIDMDGDLLGVRVPRTLERARPGRGYAVTAGVADIVQVGA